MHVLHDALALLRAGLDAFAFAQAVEIALEELFTLVDARLQLGVRLFDVGE